MAKFQKGESGNPGGRPKTKPWTDALREAVNKAVEGEDKTALELIAERVIDEAVKGDMAAVKEIANRLEGRPPASITIKGDPDEPFTVEPASLEKWKQLAAIMRGRNG